MIGAERFPPVIVHVDVAGSIKAVCERGQWFKLASEQMYDPNILGLIISQALLKGHCAMRINPIDKET